MLAGLIYAKYAMGDEETKHHVAEELKASLTAFGIIAASSIGAQGLKIDIENNYKESFGQAAKLEDKVALVTMASSIISPLATTVSASAALTEEAQSISHDIWKLKNPNTETNNERKLDHPTVAALIDHVANASGFVLVGDPPFIAMIEKFGVKNAFAYQFQTMLPLAMLSLFSANVKINEQALLAEGKSSINAKIEAGKRSYDALKRNLPFMAKIMSETMLNVGRAISKNEQNPKGFEIMIKHVLEQKLINTAKLFANNEDFKFPLHDHNAFSGLTQEHFPELEADENIVGSTIEQMVGGPVDKVHNEVTELIEHEDYDGLEKWLATHGGQSAIALVEVLRKTAHDKADKFISSGRSGFSQFLEASLPGIAGDFYKRINTHRVHNALGPQLSDVLNVFPFQAGSVIFLTPVFQDLFDGVRTSIVAKDEELSTAKDLGLDAVTYSAIMGFSTIADNYVAAKLGLEVDPDKAHVILAAAIRGGANLSPLSNMADPTLIPMHLYGLEDSWKQLSRGAGFMQHGVAFAYSEAVDKILIPMGLINVPAPITQSNVH